MLSCCICIWKAQSLAQIRCGAPNACRVSCLVVALCLLYSTCDQFPQYLQIKHHFPRGETIFKTKNAESLRCTTIFRILAGPFPLWGVSAQFAFAKKQIRPFLVKSNNLEISPIPDKSCSKEKLRITDKIDKIELFDTPYLSTVGQSVTLRILVWSGLIHFITVCMQWFIWLCSRVHDDDNYSIWVLLTKLKLFGT